MPNRYSFNKSNLPTCKEITANKNMQYNSIVGCNYVPKHNEFKPHNKPKSLVDKGITTLKDKAKTKTQEVATDFVTTQIENTTGVDAGLILDSAKDLKKTAEKLVEDKDKHLKSAKAMQLRASKPLQPTIDHLDKATIDKSRLVKASKIANNKGFKAAQDYLNENQLDFAIDTELSTRESLVLHNENEVKIAYRGTKPTNAKDLLTDFLIWQGHEERSPQFKASKEQIKRATSKYGQVDELLGYSLGGNKAISMGNLHNIKSTTFNPFLGKSLYKGSPPKTTTVRHKVFRTTDDFATFGLAMMTRKQHNLDVDSILPHKDTLDIREAHELENFTELGPRRASFVEDLAQTVHSTGARLAELESVKGMVDSIKRGQTFTEHIHEFNSGRGTDTIETEHGVKLTGGRMHRGSLHDKLWQEVTGHLQVEQPYTTEELQHFDSIDTSEKLSQSRGTTSQDVVDFLNASTQEQNQTIMNATAKHEAALEAFATQPDSIVALHSQSEAVRESINIYGKTNTSNFRSGLARAVHPVNLGTGFIGGAAASELFDTLESRTPLELNEPTRAIGEGFTAGVASEVAAAGLTRGTTIFAGAAAGGLSAASLGVAGVAGAAGYGASYGTEKLAEMGLHNIGVDGEVNRGISMTTANAVGGAVGAGVGIGGAALLGMELGSMGGPVGIALGAGVGGVIGLASFLLGEHDEHHDEYPIIPYTVTDPRNQYYMSQEGFLELDRIRQERQRQYEADGNSASHKKVAVEGLKDLLQMEASGEYDSKRQEHLDELRRQYNEGTLPDHLSRVFDDTTKFAITPTHTADQYAAPDDLPPAADFSDLAVGADESTVVTHELG